MPAAHPRTRTGYVLTENKEHVELVRKRIRERWDCETEIRVVSGGQLISQGE